MLIRWVGDVLALGVIICGIDIPPDTTISVENNDRDSGAVKRALQSPRSNSIKHILESTISRKRRYNYIANSQIQMWVEETANLTDTLPHRQAGSYYVLGLNKENVADIKVISRYKYAAQLFVSFVSLTLSNAIISGKVRLNISNTFNQNQDIIYLIYLARRY
jgi:hypothetical protein